MLRELQHDMQRYLLGQASDVCGAIVDSPPLPAAERLGIYRNAYQVRLIDALHETYPILHGLLGDETYFAMGAAFVAEYPSTHRSIRWYGSELPQFLARHSPYDGQPILAELARLEWTLAEVFDATDATPLERTELARLAPDAWATAGFVFHPALRRLEFRWNTAAVWKAMSREETPPAPTAAEAPAPWLLWRQGLQNYFRSMAGAEALALDTALQGCNFSEICEALAACLPAEEIPPAAASFLGTWTDSGLIIAIA